MYKQNLCLFSICHFLVDGICASALMTYGNLSMIYAIILYNTFAFSTQFITGLLPDKYGRNREFIFISAIILLIAIIFPWPFWLRAIILGLGNSLFHVSGGHYILKESDKLSPLGIFVAPGAIGLFLGLSFPKLMSYLMLVFLVISLIILREALDGKHPDKIQIEHNNKIIKNRILLTNLLLIAIMMRAFGGVVVDFSWKSTFTVSLMLVIFVYLGKTFGGILADKYSINKIAIISIVSAAIFILLFNDNMILSLLGQFALNLSMPITLYLIYKLYPDRPGFAFGLAASALWPGMLIGKLVELNTLWSNILTIISFIIGLVAIILTTKELNEEETLCQ